MYLRAGSSTGFGSFLHPGALGERLIFFTASVSLLLGSLSALFSAPSSHLSSLFLAWLASVSPYCVSVFVSVTLAVSPFCLSLCFLVLCWSLPLWAPYALSFLPGFSSQLW